MLTIYNMLGVKKLVQPYKPCFLTHNLATDCTKIDLEGFWNCATCTTMVSLDDVICTMCCHGQRPTIPHLNMKAEDFPQQFERLQGLWRNSRGQTFVVVGTTVSCKKNRFSYEIQLDGGYFNLNGWKLQIQNGDYNWRRANDVMKWYKIDESPRKQNGVSADDQVFRDMEKMNMAIAEITNQRNSLEQKSKTLEIQLAESKQKCQFQLKQTGQIESKLRKSQCEIDSLKQDNNCLQTCYDGAVKQLIKMSDEVQEGKRALEKANEQLEHSRTNVGNLQEDIYRLTLETSHKDKEIRELQIENSNTLHRTPASLGRFIQNFTTEQLSDVIRETQKQLELALQETNNCIICTVEKRSLICLPCGHFHMCKKCGEQVDKCPVCRKPIARLQEVFA